MEFKCGLTKTKLVLQKLYRRRRVLLCSIFKRTLIKFLNFKDKEKILQASGTRTKLSPKKRLSKTDTGFLIDNIEARRQRYII